MILAIFGASAVGKTTLAGCLASRLTLPLRHCGNAIREAADVLGISPSDLSFETHHEVDARTVDWCLSHACLGCIVEGRFLDHVLAITPSILFIELRADGSTRASRWARRLERNFEESELATVDEADAFFRQKMYESVPKGSAAMTIDTTCGTVKEWAEIVRTQLLGEPR